MNTLLDQHDTGRGTLHHPLDPREDTYDAGSLHAADDAPRERELTLGTSTILALFFALAILCAAFFAFGYSLGGKHGVPNPVTVSSATAPALAPVQGITTTGIAKPSPGSPVGKPPAQAISPETVTVPATPVAVVVKPPATPVRTPDATPDPPWSAASPAAPGSIVQVAAVSHKEDAELIASTLKRRGYAVSIRNEPQDKLLHLQLGPFPSRKDAEAMRQRLLADGFNAYIK